jgi:hypothetical protein
MSDMQYENEHVTAAVAHMNEAKQLISKAVEECQTRTPTLINASRVAMEHLDTSYLWLSQVNMFLRPVLEVVGDAKDS